MSYRRWVALIILLLGVALNSLATSVWAQDTAKRGTSFLVEVYCHGSLAAVGHLDLRSRVLAVYPLIVQCGPLTVDARRLVITLLTRVADMGLREGVYTFEIPASFYTIRVSLRLTRLPSFNALPLTMLVDLIVVVGAVIVWLRAERYEVF